MRVESCSDLIIDPDWSKRTRRRGSSLPVPHPSARRHASRRLRPERRSVRLRPRSAPHLVIRIEAACRAAGPCRRGTAVARLASCIDDGGRSRSRSHTRPAQRPRSSAPRDALKQGHAPSCHDAPPPQGDSSRRPRAKSQGICWSGRRGAMLDAPAFRVWGEEWAPDWGRGR